MTWDRIFWWIFLNIKFLNFTVQKELKEAFRLYDKEGNGYIPTSVLKEILHELDDQLSDGELDGIISEIDQGMLELFLIILFKFRFYWDQACVSEIFVMYPLSVLA